MKKLTIVIAAFIVGSSVQAQNKETKTTPPYSKFVVSINGGIASPTGNFSKGDYADERSGFAKTGANFNVTGTYYFSKCLGITALIGYSHFGYKGSQSLSDGYKEDSGTDST